MNQSRDIRSLKDYEEHFARYNKKVINESNSSKDTIGIIQYSNGYAYFIPVLYHGHKINDRLLRTFVKGE